MKKIKSYVNRICRIRLGLQSWHRVSKSGLFDAQKYMQINPGLGKLPWYLTPALHWVMYGRGIEPLNPTNSHLINAELTLIAEGKPDLQTIDREILSALDLRDITRVKSLMQKCSEDYALLVAFHLARIYMDVGSAKVLILSLNSSGYQPPNAILARKWLDLARATGVNTEIAYAALDRFLLKMKHEERIFLARLPQSEDLTEVPTNSARLLSWRETITSGNFNLSAIFEAATANEAGRARHIVKKVDDKIIIEKHNKDSSFAPTTKIRVLMPLYWVEPQRSHSVLGPVSRVMIYLFKFLLDSGECLYPVWATPIYDISYEKNFGYRTLSYHSICHPQQALTGDVHFKESYLPGWFGLDATGYSGWASINSRDLSSLKDLQKDQNFVSKLRHEYLSASRSKYRQSNTSAPPPGYIFVALQVPDDTVATLGHMPTAVWTRTLMECARGNRVAFKRHPKDTSRQTDDLMSMLSGFSGYIQTDAPINALISGSKFVVTVNSGVGFESLIGGQDVITCGKSDYSTATVEVETPIGLRKAIDDALDGNHPVSSNNTSAFIRAYLNQTGFTLDNMETAERALRRN